VHPSRSQHRANTLSNDCDLLHRKASFANVAHEAIEVADGMGKGR